MNISEQLSLLQDIKDDFKTRLIEIGANLDEETPFSQYPEYIKPSNKSVFTDKIIGSTIKKDDSVMLITDKYCYSTNVKDKTLKYISDKLSCTTNETDFTLCLFNDSVEYYRNYSNPVMTSNSMNGWEASASREANPAYWGFNKDMTGDNCWWTGTNISLPCYIALSFDHLYKIRSVEIINENTSPENFKDGLIQFRTNSEAEWETLYEITNRPNISAYSEEYIINSDNYYKEFRLYITSIHGSTASIQNININFKE